MNATDCASKLLTFLEDYDLDGANIDFRDVSSFQNGAIEWITKFTLGLNDDKKASKYIFSHSVDIPLFDQSQYPMGDYSLIEKAVGQYIKFYNVRYWSSKSNFTTYKEFFSHGTSSVDALQKRGIPLSKIIIAKPSLYNATGYVRPDRLIHYYRKANAQLGWWGGAMFSPYIN